MHLLGLIGHQIDHSLSPLLHTYWLKKHQIKGGYHLCDLGAAPTRNDFQLFLKQQFKGVNITAPYKEQVWEWVVADPSTRLRAINTLSLLPNGTYKGINTDFLAAKDFLATFPRDIMVVILGNGGTARALIEALYQLGFSSLHLIQRQQKQWPAAYAPFLHFHFWQGASAMLIKADLIINTVPCLSYQLPPLKPHTIIWDYTYGNKASTLEAQCYDKKIPFVGGIEFLIRQAQYSFYEWFSIFPESTADLRRQLIK